MQKARLLYLNDKYEELLTNRITGKYKSYYVGKIGNVVHKQNIRGIVSSNEYLYDIEFDDGARFCVDREQIEFVGENEG